MRIYVHKGLLLNVRLVVDPHDMDADAHVTSVDYQIFNLDGTPSTGDYRGEGAIVGDRLILGDPYTQATLHEYLIAKEPTPESWDRYEGFWQAIHDRRQKKTRTKATADKSDWWWSGYNEGWQEKRDRQTQKRATNPVSKRAKDLLRAENPSRQRNYLASSAPCEIDANTAWPKHWETGRRGRGLEVIDRKEIGDRSVAAKDVWIDGNWQGVYWYCLNRPDTEGWNWLAADGHKVEHTTLNNVQAERALVAHMGHGRKRNPEQDTAEFVRAHAADTTWQQRIPGGTTKPPRAFNPEALAAGTLVELEHTSDPATAMEIAMDHLDRDPRHYRHEVKAMRQRNPAQPGASRPAMRENHLSRRLKDA